MTWGSPRTDQSHDASLNALQLWHVEKLGEILSELRTLRQQTDHHLASLPERTATQMVLHINRAGLCTDPRGSVAGSGSWGRMKQFTALLKNGLPYVVLTRQIGIAIVLWGLITTGAIKSGDLTTMIVGYLRSWSGN